MTSLRRMTLVFILFSTGSLMACGSLKPRPVGRTIFPSATNPPTVMPASDQAQIKFTQKVMGWLVAADGARYQPIFCGVANCDFGTTAVWCMIIRESEPPKNLAASQPSPKRRYGLIYAFDTALTKPAETKLRSLRDTPGFGKLSARTFFDQTGATTFVCTGDEVFVGTKADPAENGYWKVPVLLRLVDDTGFIIGQAVGMSHLRPTDFFY